MTKRQQKNHQGARKPFGLQTGKLILSDGFQKQYSLLWKAESHYGAPGGIAGYFRNTKNSSLNAIKRLRILSV